MKVIAIEALTLIVQSILLAGCLLILLFAAIAQASGNFGFTGIWQAMHAGLFQ